jgi:hypothetical protein
MVELQLLAQFWYHQNWRNCLSGESFGGERLPCKWWEIDGVEEIDGVVERVLPCSGGDCAEVVQSQYACRGWLPFRKYYYYPDEHFNNYCPRNNGWGCWSMLLMRVPAA